MAKSKKKLPYYPSKILAESKIHGGKSYTCRRIFMEAPADFIAHPENWRYIDFYGGAGSMTYNAPEGIGFQVFNDIHPFRVMCKRAIKTCYEPLRDKLLQVTYNEESFKQYQILYQKWEKEFQLNKTIMEYTNNVIVDAVIAWLCTNRMSRNGDMTSFSWTPESTRLRGGQQAETNAWQEFMQRLWLLHTRLEKVEIFNLFTLKLLKAIVKAQKQYPGQYLLYFDPPYPHETRSTKDEYEQFEMPTRISQKTLATQESHEDLLLAVLALDPKIFKVIISSYHNPLYDKMLAGWRTVEFNMPNHASQQKDKQRRVEVLYMNY